VTEAGASLGSDAAWVLPAEPSAVGTLRRRAAAFASAVGAPDETAHAVALAVSETVTNVVAHAYANREVGPVTVTCRAEGSRVVVEVADEGAGMAARHDSPGAGQGLTIVGALAETLEVVDRPDGPGVVVTMSFDPEPAAPAPNVQALEPLCALALETVADVSCVDAVSGGVLRRVAAEVAHDSDATTWLRNAAPPAKPGTATWAALRDGGVRLVVHDPTLPRTTGGTGERLDLTWWISVPLDGPDGEPAALWGLGGRAGGRPVPPEEIRHALAEAARAGLADAAQRAALSTRLRKRGSVL
jgi:anti-sigma regulatory factor (Ser/Thr protein kinase)